MKRPKAVDDHYRLSAPLGTIDLKGTTRKSTPAGAATPHGRGLAESKGHDRLMSIVEPTSDTWPPPPEHLGMSRADGCPECIYNLQPPASSAPLVGGYRNTYVCKVCDFAWTTEWAA